MQDYGSNIILVLIDTRLPDLVRVKSRLQGWRMLHLSRPHDVNRKKQRPYGGITVLWHPDYNRVCRESSYPKGMLSFVYQDAAQRYRPVPVIALYSPPIGSLLNSNGKHWSDDIMTSAEAESRRLRILYGFVCVVGDYNWRIGRSFNRTSDDDINHAANARTQPAINWHNRCNLRPLYGRPGQHREECTSRVNGFTAAPDGISCPEVIPQGWTVQALAPPAWEQYSTGGGVHRPIGVLVTPPVSEAAEPTGSPGQPEAQPAKSLRYFPAAYSDEVYHKMAPAVLKCLTDAAQRLSAREITPAQTMQSIAENLVSIQSQYFTQRKPWRAQRKARCRRDIRRRNPTSMFRRAATGISMPNEVKEIAKKHRTTLARAQAMRNKAKRLRAQCAAAVPEHVNEAEIAAADLDRRAENVEKESSFLRREIKRRMENNSLRYYGTKGDYLAKLLRKNPHKFFRLMKGVIPETHELYDESAGPSAQLARELREFFAHLFKKPAQQPDGAEHPRFDTSFPDTNVENTRRVLLAEIKWQAVYAVLFPAHRDALCRYPCQHGCKLCPLFSAHVRTAHSSPGNTFITQPEHRPRLWTSKSAGPDGVFAETLRWSCPKDRSERFEHRKQVCIALASIFNQFIADGVVPQCPQFADAAMSVLFKGAGSREDPSNYRGICVPNVLAKLFGLVLGTRLSHWAVTNGVISPAQAGFVVLHGCEYHIMTLLETLRHRIRRNRDTVVVFLDFRKAYDNVSQELAWKVMQRMGVPTEFTNLLKSWSDQSRIVLRTGDAPHEPFPQEKGVPQGGVLSPIIFNLVLEVLLRYVNAHAAELGVELSAEAAQAARRGAANANGVPPVPPSLKLLALAYADDVVLICPSQIAAQRALDLVQDWAEHFGFTIGVGAGKTEAMLFQAEVVKEACKKDENGMLNPKYRGEAEADPEDDPSDDYDHDDDHSTVLDDDEIDDPEADDDSDDERDAAGLRPGQQWEGGRKRGKHTITPLKFKPRPLPPIPKLNPLGINHSDGQREDVPWTNRYKYLGFVIRSDLMDDDAFQRLELKMRIALERLFPYHTLVRAFPLGHKIQLLQTLALAVTGSMIHLLTSMRAPTELKTTRLDNMRKRVAKEVVRLHHTSRRDYVMSEVSLGDVYGEITMHRLRLLESLQNHPLRDAALPLDRQPIACRVLDIMTAESQYITQHGNNATPLLLAPWPLLTKRITDQSVATHTQRGGSRPLHRWEIAPYASAVARIGERERWLDAIRKKDFDPDIDSFAMRPPSNGTRHVAAMHFPGRLDGSEVGLIPKLTPLSCRGPHAAGSIVALSRLASSDTFMISKARQGNQAMHIYPFAQLWRTAPKVPGQKRKASGASKAIAFEGKTCHLCCEDESGPGYDLWHVLFECRATMNNPAIVGVRRECQNYVMKLCDHIVSAVDHNAEGMSSTEHASVSHDAIRSAVQSVRGLAKGYNWDCTPGRWLTYCLLLAMPYSEKVVTPPQGSASPALPNAQYSLPCAVGRVFDATILSNDALRPLADDWCKLAVRCLRAAGQTVCPLRAAAEQRREPAKEAARKARHTTAAALVAPAAPTKKRR